MTEKYFHNLHLHIDQDTTGIYWEDEDGSVFQREPTFNWILKLTATRSDEEYFYTQCLIANEDINKINDGVSFLIEEVNGLISYMNEFLDCKCELMFPCERHK